jgi:hypothetical protein
LLLNVSNGNAAATLGEEIAAANVNGQRDFVVARHSGRCHHAATLQLCIYHRHAIAFAFLRKQ